MKFVFQKGFENALFPMKKKAKKQRTAILLTTDLFIYNQSNFGALTPKIALPFF